MKILIACEFSGIVREAFTVRGHDVTSCDLYATEIPGKHYQGNVLDIIDQEWDMMIAHPPCTYLTNARNRWMADKYKERFPNFEQDRKDAIQFFMEMICADIPKICVENPVGIMSRFWKKPEQIIQPYEYGHKEAKRTCLWLKNLPKLIPTKIVEPEYMTFKSGKRMSKEFALAVTMPKEERMKFRSRTFYGIANAMANQWG